MVSGTASDAALQTDATESQRMLSTFCSMSGSGGCSGLIQLGSIQDVPGSLKHSVAQSLVSARTMIDREQNPPSEDEDELWMDMVVSTSSIVQRERFYPLTITVHHQNNGEGGDKTSQTPWEGDYMNWFLWQPACRENKIIPWTWVTAGCILQTQHGVNKHVLEGTNSSCSLFLRLRCKQRFWS